jgi:hypothetical protein
MAPTVLKPQNAFPGLPAPQHLSGQSGVQDFLYPGAVQPYKVPIPPAPTTIPSDYFGMTINGPVESGLTWPVWAPTTFRILDQYASAYANEYLPGWNYIEPSSGSYYWTMFDAVAAKYIAESVTDVIWGFEGVPQWAENGNAYSFSCTIAASTGVVTATGNNFSNGQLAFFTGGTTGPFTAGTVYYVVINPAARSSCRRPTEARR